MTPAQQKTQEILLCPPLLEIKHSDTEDEIVEKIAYFTKEKDEEIQYELNNPNNNNLYVFSVDDASRESCNIFYSEYVMASSRKEALMKLLSSTDHTIDDFNPITNKWSCWFFDRIRGLIQ